jgi:hypothetical protein
MVGLGNKYPKQLLNSAVHTVHGSWEIGLAEIQYPHSWYNVRKNEVWILFTDRHHEKHVLVLPEGYYASPPNNCSTVRPQSTVLRFDRQVVNVDYDYRVQDEYLTQKYDLRSRYLFSKGDPRRCAVRVTRRIFTQLDWRIAYGSEMYRNQTPGILSQRRPRWNSGRNIVCRRDTESHVSQTTAQRCVHKVLFSDSTVKL